MCSSSSLAWRLSCCYYILYTRTYTHTYTTCHMHMASTTDCAPALPSPAPAQFPHIHIYTYAHRTSHMPHTHTCRLALVLFLVLAPRRGGRIRAPAHTGTAGVGNREQKASSSANLFFGGLPLVPRASALAPLPTHNTHAPPPHHARQACAPTAFSCQFLHIQYHKSPGHTRRALPNNGQRGRRHARTRPLPGAVLIQLLLARAAPLACSTPGAPAVSLRLPVTARL